MLAIGTRRFWAASCSMCTGALQVIARDGNQLQTCSTSVRRRMGPEKAFCALGPAPQPSPAREGPPAGPSQKGHKTSCWELPSRKGNSPRESKLSPSACVLSKAALAGFAPRPVLALLPRRVWAAPCSLCSGAWPSDTGAGKQLQTCSPSGRRRMGSEKALCALVPAPHLSSAREGPT